MLSSFLRIISGLTVLGLAYRTYSQNQAALEAHQPLEIAGRTVVASPEVFYAVLTVIGLIGLVLLGLGIRKLTRRNP